MSALFKAPASAPLDIVSLPLEKIRIDGDTQSRVAIDMATVDEYARLLTEGVKLPPGKSCFDGVDDWPYDGFHRLWGHRKAGIPVMEWERTRGTKEDAQWLSLGANTSHGLARSNLDKAKCIQSALKARPHLSDREIGRHCGVDHKTVGVYRERMFPKAPPAASPADAALLDAAQKFVHATNPKPANGGEFPQTTGPKITAEEFEMGLAASIPAKPSSTPPAKPTDAKRKEDKETPILPGFAAVAKMMPDGGGVPTHDMLGNLLPDDLREAFDDRQEFRMLIDNAHEIWTWGTDQVRKDFPGFAALPQKEFEEVVARLLGMLQASRPYALCPKCAGKRCPVCEGRGWVTESQLESIQAQDAYPPLPEDLSQTKEAIMIALRSFGDAGANRAQLADRSGLGANTINARISELLRFNPELVYESAAPRDGFKVLFAAKGAGR